MNEPLLAPDELSRKAIGILCRELGIADTARFLCGRVQGRGNYTQERDLMFADKTVDEIAADIEAWKAANPEIGPSPTLPAHVASS